MAAPSNLNDASMLGASQCNNLLLSCRLTMEKDASGKPSTQKTLQAFFHATKKFSNKDAVIKAVDDDEEDIDDPEKTPDDDGQLGKTFGEHFISSAPRSYTQNCKSSHH